jgi:hypothetical protein
MSEPMKTMMLRTFLLMTALALAGCGGGPEASHPLPDWPQDVPPLEDLLLEPETVEQTYDEGAEDETMGESGLRVAEQGLVNDPAVLLPYLRQGLLISNIMARTGLGLLGSVARSGPPVSADSNKLVWEVRDKGALYTLRIERDVGVAGRWNYQLLVGSEAAGDADVPRLLLGGWFHPGQRDGGRQTGSGLIRYDYDAFASLPDAGESVRGVGAFGFRTDRAGGLRMRVILDGFKPKDSDQRLDAQYIYRLAPDNGGGEFRFLLKADIIQAIEGDEVLGETVVWGPNRAAKAKALIVNPNIETELRIDECWNLRGRQVWVQYDPAELAESDGDEGDCAGPLAELELPDPDIGPLEPGTLPEVPE